MQITLHYNTSEIVNLPNFKFSGMLSLLQSCCRIYVSVYMSQKCYHLPTLIRKTYICIDLLYNGDANE